MASAQIRCVVGIDVAKDLQVVCALEAPGGALRQRATRIEASAQGYAQLVQWLQAWGEPDTLLIGLEATGVLWEPLYEAVTQAGYSILVLNPRQTSSWAASLGLRAKTDSIDAHTLARGLLAGYARASTLPSEAVQSLRTLTRARRDLVQSQTAARQRLQDELVPLFPELPRHLPGHADLADPAILSFLSCYSSAQALARADLAEVTDVLASVSGKRWGEAEAQALQHLAQHSAASSRAVVARSLVVRTLCLHLLDLRARLAELEAAIATVVEEDEEAGRLQQIPGIGPQNAATIRAELGDVSRFSRVEQVIAYAGLEPRTHESGRFAGQKRLSKRGPGALRHALYLATLVAVRFRAEWRLRYQRLLERGRTKKEALTILSRALLKVIYHLLRTGASYDPARVGSPGTGS
ncbi:MAG TPA: IS110 family transposase [Ktedonobacterales bacterium]|jgi:transposase